jgi:predicted nucleotidyltransferase
MSQDVLSALKTWAQNLRHAIGTDGVYVFGSLIYRNGLQFGDMSDIDLVVRFPKSTVTALHRVHWLEALHSAKIDLESELSALLKRDKNKPICSMVVRLSKRRHVRVTGSSRGKVHHC